MNKVAKLKNFNNLLTKWGNKGLVGAAPGANATIRSCGIPNGKGLINHQLEFHSAATRQDAENVTILEDRQRNVSRVKSMEQYETHVYDSSKLIVCLFTAKFCLWSKLLLPSYQDLSKSYANVEDVVFLHVDVDEVPRAAYHADVENVPMVILMRNDDAFRERIQATDQSHFQTILPKTSEVLKAQLSSKHIKAKGKRFSWYDHNIRKDNLNVYRVGWDIPEY